MHDASCGSVCAGCWCWWRFARFGWGLRFIERAYRWLSFCVDIIASMQTDATLWRRLKVGDYVRLVHMPTEFSRPGYLIYPNTLRAYKRVIKRGRPQRIFQIDAWGVPWISFRFKMKKGKWEYHELAINHDGLVPVRPRKIRRLRSK